MRGKIAIEFTCYNWHEKMVFASRDHLFIRPRACARTIFIKKAHLFGLDKLNKRRISCSAKTTKKILQAVKHLR